jgi:hypothetical protein
MFMGWIWIGHLKHIHSSIRPYLCWIFLEEKLPLATPSLEVGTILKDKVEIGLLGADLAIENGKYRIKKIYTGESWN